MVDPISDMLNRIKNAQAVKKETVEIPFSKIRFEIGKILERTKFVRKVDLKTKKSRRSIELALQYADGMPAVSGTERISKPGKRMYASSSELRRTGKHQGIVIVSTSKGLLTAGESRKQGLGGEIICEVW